MASINEVIKVSNVLVQDNRFDEALELVKPFLNSSNSEKALFQCGKIMINAGRENLAKVYLDEFCSISKKNYEDTLLWIINFKSHKKDFDTAEEYIAKLIAMNASNQTQAILSLSRAYLDFGNESKALEKVNQVLETDPNEPRAIFILGKILRVQGKNEEALFQFKKLVEMQSINMVQALEVIREIEIELKFKHVAPEKRKLVQQEITNYLSLCKKYISKYEYENAEECCNRIFELGYADIAKENLDIIKIFKMGDYYYSEVEEYEEAIRCYEKIYSNKDYMNEAYNRVSLVKVMMKTETAHIRELNNKAQEIIKEYSTCIKANAFQLAYNCCDKLEEMGYIEEAEIRRHAVRLFEEASEYTTKREFKSAIDCCEKAKLNNSLIKLANFKIEGIRRTINCEKKKHNQEKEPKEEERYEKIECESAAKLIINKADAYLSMGLSEKALPYYLKLIKSCFYVKEALYGIFAIKIRDGETEELDKYLTEYKEYFTETEYYRLSTYYNINMSAEEKEKNQKNILRHILNRHEGDFYDYLDIEHIYYAIINAFENSSLTNANSFKYCISFDEPIACLDGEETNCIEVVSFIEKSNIITMYPVIRHGDVIKMKERVKKL